MAEHVPRELDKFWDENRALKGLQANGYIYRVQKSGSEIESVTVKFFDTVLSQDKYVRYFYGEIQGFYVNQTLGYNIYI